MTNTPDNPFDDGDQPNQPPQMPSVPSARVPEAISRGVFSTGAIVLMGQHSFVLDFVQQFGSPPQVVARVVMPQVVLGQLVAALDQNLGMYAKKFGDPPTIPRPENQPKPSIEDIYSSFKLTDEVQSGTFAEGVLIRHSPADFCFDFITRFYPQAMVSKRVFVSAPNIPPLLKALRTNLQRLQDGPLPPHDSDNPPEDPE